tara:strand:+ start:59 stop:688 length:630 start_codon:yes stop_codon:yes gene_type:complete
MNKIITFEGVDGCGKTTQINLLSDYLNSRNKENIIVREPGGTCISERIREILLDEDNSINSVTETLLFLSSRSQLVNEIIKKKMNNSKFILFDRFIDSTIAYQGYGRGLDIEKLKSLNDFATENLKPDLTFILDIELSESLRRINTNTMDRMEKSGKSFLKRVISGYKAIALEKQSRYKLIDCNNKKPNDINLEIIYHLDKFYKGREYE